jgi:hypothetical protein
MSAIRALPGPWVGSTGFFLHYGARTCECDSSQVGIIMLCHEVLFQEQVLLEEELLWSIPADVSQ